MDNAQIVRDWIAQNQPACDRWVQNAVKRFSQDTSRRLPRTPQERRNGFALWLGDCRAKLVSSFAAEFRQEFPSLDDHLASALIAQVFNTQVWPEVEAVARSYVVRGLAASWVSGHLGDATTVGRPEAQGSYWRIPLGMKGRSENLGQVVLNSDGDIIPELTTSRAQILEVLRGSTIPPIPAAARQ